MEQPRSCLRSARRVSYHGALSVGLGIAVLRPVIVKHLPFLELQTRSCMTSIRCHPPTQDERGDVPVICAREPHQRADFTPASLSIGLAASKNFQGVASNSYGIDAKEWECLGFVGIHVIILALGVDLNSARGIVGAG